MNIKPPFSIDVVIVYLVNNSVKRNGYSIVRFSQLKNGYNVTNIVDRHLSVIVKHWFYIVDLTID